MKCDAAVIRVVSVRPVRMSTRMSNHAVIFGSKKVTRETGPRSSSRASRTLDQNGSGSVRRLCPDSTQRPFPVRSQRWRPTTTASLPAEVR